MLTLESKDQPPSLACSSSRRFVRDNGFVRDKLPLPEGGSLTMEPPDVGRLDTTFSRP